MKRLIPYIMTAFLLLSITPAQLKAVPDSRTKTKTAAIQERNTAASANSHTLLSRLSEIRAMDFSDLNSADKKNLRKELRSMKSQLNALGGTVYISAGALILILILLILLL